MKSHRRTILKVIALLAAGATLNVAVAWGCTLRFAPGLNTGAERKMASDQLTGILRTSFHDVPVETASLFGGVHSGITWQNSRAMCWNGKCIWFVIRSTSGWPVQSLMGQSVSVGNPAAHIEGYQFAFRIPDWLRPYMAKKALVDFFPLRPLWPGFAINTLFYAGVLWMLFCGPFALRRMIRKRRGRCLHCAYPIGQSPVCTECGAQHAPPRI